MQTEELIKGEHVLLICNRGDRKIVQLKNKKPVKWRKKNINIAEQLIGQQYNKIYEVLNDGNIKESPEFAKEFHNIDKNSDDESNSDEDNEEEKEQGISCNKNFTCDQTAQKLSDKDINNLKQEVSKQQLIEKLTDNSATFKDRTQFSQEKYIKRKKRKYFFYFTCQKTSAENLVLTHYQYSAPSISHIRIDSFSLLMHYCNIRPGANILLFEQTKGLILGSITQRLNNKGKILFCNNNLNYQKQLNQLIHYNQLNVPKSLDNSIQQFTEQELVEKIQEPKFSSLVVVGDYDLIKILQNCAKMVQTGGVIVAFSNHLEVLSQAFDYLYNLTDMKFINIKITDIWMREYQVLENRTHPKTSMSGFSGYIFHAYKVENG